MVLLLVELASHTGRRRRVVRWEDFATVPSVAAPSAASPCRLPCCLVFGSKEKCVWPCSSLLAGAHGPFRQLPSGNEFTKVTCPASRLHLLPPTAKRPRLQRLLPRSSHVLPRCKIRVIHARFTMVCCGGGTAPWSVYTTLNPLNPQ